MRETLNFVIEKSIDTLQKGTFIVPSVCKHLCIRYDLKEPFTFLVFMLIRNPEGRIRFQKQLSYSTPVICIGEDETDTTIGGIPGAMEPGIWSVDIYIFSEHVERMMQGLKLPFTLTISDEKENIPEKIGGPVWVDEEFYYSRMDKNKIYQKESRWYKGDFHTHTQLSDGKELPREANEKAKLMELDYYVATEHNMLHTGWPETDVLIMPGVEITTSIGHANLFGIDRRPKALDDILLHKREEELSQDIEEIVKECRERGWLFSINHPFLYIWKWLYGDMKLENMDCLEINNDPTYEADPDAAAKEANKKAVYLADLLWSDGYRICAIGGSDSHKKIDEFYPGATEPSIPGDPATYLYTDELSENNIRRALKNCHCYVTRHCSIDCKLTVLDENRKILQEVMFGDRLPQEGKMLLFQLDIIGPKEPPEIYLIKNGEKELCQVAETGENSYRTRETVYLQQDGYQWIRFGAEDARNEFLFYGNPVTKGEKEHSFHTFKEIKGYLEERWR